MRANQVAIGSATNTYTLAGVTSAASTAAQIGATQFVTTDSHGNLAAVDLGPTLGGLSGQINTLSSNIHDVRQEARGGVALAMASGQIRYDERPGKVSVGAAFGDFINEGGAALGIGYTAPNGAVRVNLSCGGTFRGDAGVVAGISLTLN
jgi:autotransporter adhesin